MSKIRHAVHVIDGVHLRVGLFQRIEELPQLSRVDAIARDLVRRLTPTLSMYSNAEKNQTEFMAKAMASKNLTDVAEGTVGLLNAAIRDGIGAMVFIDRSGRPLRYLTSYLERAMRSSGDGNVPRFPRTFSMNGNHVDAPVSEREAAIELVQQELAPFANIDGRVLVVDDQMASGGSLNRAAKLLTDAFPGLQVTGAIVLNQAPPWHMSSGVYGTRAGVIEYSNGPHRVCIHDPGEEALPEWVQQTRSDVPASLRAVFAETFPTPRHIAMVPEFERDRLEQQHVTNLAFLSELRSLASIIAANTSVLEAGTGISQTGVDAEKATPPRDNRFGLG